MYKVSPSLALDSLVNILHHHSQLTLCSHLPELPTILQPTQALAGFAYSLPSAGRASLPFPSNWLPTCLSRPNHEVTFSITSFSPSQAEFTAYPFLGFSLLHVPNSFRMSLCSRTFHLVLKLPSVCLSPPRLHKLLGDRD